MRFFFQSLTYFHFIHSFLPLLLLLISHLFRKHPTVSHGMTTTLNGLNSLNEMVSILAIMAMLVVFVLLNLDLLTAALNHSIDSELVVAVDLNVTHHASQDLDVVVKCQLHL